MDTLRQALLEAIDAAPCSDRALAREAGLAHTTLIRIREGRLHATPAVLERVAAALERWSGQCGMAAEKLRAEQKRHSAGG
jgi:transcriptional regulator with XRE-family HTH domain